MKCPKCGSKGFHLIDYTVCSACNGTGKIEVEQQTNEKWAKSFDTEHFAKLLYDAMIYGQQCDKDDVTCEECGCPWCKTDSISEWLKQPHKDANKEKESKQ